MGAICATIGHCAGHIETAVELKVYGQPLRLRVRVPDGPANLAVVMPLAGRLAEKIAQKVARRLRAEGKRITCRKGCAACCKYLVPLSVPELFQLGSDLAAMPPQLTRTVAERFASTMKRIVEAGPPSIPESSTVEAGGINCSPAGASGEWYAKLEVDCPLLINRLCAIYTQRPIACRQHFVTSPARFCVGFQPGRGEVVSVPLNISHALSLLAAEMEQRSPEAVALPLAPHWLQSHQDRLRRTWPGRLLVERFGQIVQKLTA